MSASCIFKFNNGNAAKICSTCHVIIKTGKDFTDEECKACRGEKWMAPQFCDKCKEAMLKLFEK